MMENIGIRLRFPSWGMCVVYVIKRTIDNAGRFDEFLEIQPFFAPLQHMRNQGTYITTRFRFMKMP